MYYILYLRYRETQFSKSVQRKCLRKGLNSREILREYSACWTIENGIKNLTYRFLGILHSPVYTFLKKCVLSNRNRSR